MTMTTAILPCPEEWVSILCRIFERQRDLMDQYKEMEQFPNPPISLHTKHGQSIIRAFAWRVTEELAESHEAFIKHDDCERARAEGLEELADATHFLVELLIFSGLGSRHCYEKLSTFRQRNNMSITGAYWDLVYKMGLAMNFLKNKPWRKTHTPTDEARFRAAILEAWVALVRCWSVLGCTQEDMYNYYFAKSAVIDQRLQENY